VAMLGSLADTGLDLLASLVTLYGVRLAAEPADHDHRFGHGKAEALAALFQVMLITASAIAIAWRAVLRFSDVMLNFAVIVAMALDQFAGLHGADPVFGIAIALWLAFGAFRASSEAIDQLMDKEWPEEERARFLEVAARQKGLKGIHDFRTRRSGAHHFAQFHMEVDRGLTVAAAHDIVERVEKALHRAFPRAEVLIHLDPEGHVDTDNPLIEEDVTPHWFGKRV
jgi:ferrous-iron efflux pump FieF